MKGIVLKEELFKKVISGEKTETRQVIKNAPDHHWDIFEDYKLTVSIHEAQNWTVCNWVHKANGKFEHEWTRPRFSKGDFVYLKEPYVPCVHEPGFEYAFDYDHEVRNMAAWENKMFMPARAARYFIRITSVEVERLQEITTESIQREGVEWPKGAGYVTVPTPAHKDNVWRGLWRKLWDGINKPPYTWEDNPWVWVYEFELTEKPQTT